MSDDPILHNGDPAGTALQEPPRRAASVTLRRETETENLQDLMDPATKSLADALLFTYKLVWVAMGVLIVLFFGSAAQKIDQTQSGIRVFLGEAQDYGLGPGFHWSWPDPFGELVKIDSGLVEAQVREDFWFRMSDREENQLITEGTSAFSGFGSGTLDPDSDGALLTSDGGIVHTRWTAKYERADIRQWATNVLPDTDPSRGDDRFENERRIVRAALREGIVRAATELSLDEVLKDSPDPEREPGTFRTMQSLAQAYAQEALDEMETGIEIRELTKTYEMAPKSVQDAIDQVGAAESERQVKVDEARSQQIKRMIETAGDGWRELLAIIDRYERALETGDPDAEAILEEFDRAVLGESDVRVTGEVAGLISDAENYRSRTRSEAQTTLRLFQAKLPTFLESRSVLVTQDWTDAMRAFRDRDGVTATLLPSGSDNTVLQINKDPAIAQQRAIRETERRLREARAQAEDEQERERLRERSDSANVVEAR